MVKVLRFLLLLGRYTGHVVLLNKRHVTRVLDYVHWRKFNFSGIFMGFSISRLTGRHIGFGRGPYVQRG